MTSLFSLFFGVFVGFFVKDSVTFKRRVPESMFIVVYRNNGAKETVRCNTWEDAIQYIATINPTFRWEITTKPYASEPGAAGIATGGRLVGEGIGNARAGT